MSSRPRVPSNCHDCSRRSLLQGLGLAALVPLVGSSGGCTQSNTPSSGVATACTGGLCIDLGDSANAALASTGGSVLIDSANDTIIVVRTTDTTVIALSAVCTHAGCLVGFESSSDTLFCDCHGSRFGEDGTRLAGPARSPLRVYPATLDGTTITIAA